MMGRTQLYTYCTGSYKYKYAYAYTKPQYTSVIMR